MPATKLNINLVPYNLFLLCINLQVNAGTEIKALVNFAVSKEQTFKNEMHTKEGKNKPKELQQF